MGMSIFGGGWAFKTFTQFQYADAIPLTGGPGVYGAWQPLQSAGADIVTIDARWMTINFDGNSAGPTDYNFQFAVGAIGAETLFPRPSTLAGIDFFYVYFPGLAVLPGAQVLSYAFPITMAPGQRFSVRASSPLGPATAIARIMLFG